MHHRLIIIHVENSINGAIRFTSRLGNLRIERNIFYAAITARWKIDNKSSSRARLTFDGNRSFMRSNNSVNDRQPQTGSLTNRLRREKGLEQPLANRWIDARTIIGYRQPHKLAAARCEPRDIRQAAAGSSLGEIAST